jgi:internalin A
VERVRDCQLCILLVGFRRGYVPDGDELSITQQEYEHARQSGMDVLPYLLNDRTTGWPEKFDERQADPKLVAWREAIGKAHGIEKFGADPASIDIEAALNRWQRRHHERQGLRDYLASLRTTHGAIRFIGLPQLKDNRDVRIDRLFVEPWLSQGYTSADRSPENWPPTTRLLDAVVANPRLVVLGDPGSGKSTLVNWVAWNLAQPHPNDWTRGLGNLLPLPLVLRDLEVGPGVTWDRLLDSFLARPVGKHLDREQVERLLQSGDAIVLLDGLDEIGNVATRRDLHDAVYDAMRRYERVRWLLTSRIVGYESVPFHLVPAAARRNRQRGAANVDYLADVQYVAPFDDDQIRQFAANWYSEREADAALASQGGSDLVRAVHGHPDTLRLARVPNLLTIMALIHRIRARLPHGKALLYNEVTEAYLETIDDSRHLRETDDTLAEKKRWLARVGFEMQLKRYRESELEDPFEDGLTIAVPRETLRRWTFEGMQATGRRAESGDAERFLDHIRRRSGLVIDRGPDEYSFTHLSFQEYFAACHLRERIASPSWILRKNMAPATTPDDLRCYAASDLWRETLVFLFELIATEAPDWSEPLRTCLFGEDLEATAWTSVEQQPLICLLARLVVNPHAGMDDDLRREVGRRCCEWEVQRQQRAARVNLFNDAPEVLRILLSEDAQGDLRLLEALVEVAKEAELSQFSLGFTAVNTLKPLRGLTALRSLYLNFTVVSDEEIAQLKEALPDLVVHRLVSLWAAEVPQGR